MTTMQDQASTMFDDGFGTPTLPPVATGQFFKIFYFMFDRMPARIPGWESYDGHLSVPDY